MSWLDSTPPERSALVILDVQEGLVAQFASDWELIQRLVEARQHARDRGMRVVFVKVGLRGSFLDVSRRNLVFSAVQEADHLQESSNANRVSEALAPAPDEAVVTKRRTGAFSGTDLEIVLRASGVEGVVLCGIVTGGAVLSTLRAASDLDYSCAVLSDACVDADEEVHRVLMEKIFPRQAIVLTVREFVSTR